MRTAANIINPAGHRVAQQGEPNSFDIQEGSLPQIRSDGDSQNFDLLVSADFLHGPTQVLKDGDVQGIAGFGPIRVIRATGENLSYRIFENSPSLHIG